MTDEEIRGKLAGKELLIFDFDGTIADSSPLHARAFNQAFADEGVTVDYGEIAGLKTEDAVESIARKFRLHLDSDRRVELIHRKRRLARDLIAAELQALPGSLDFIHRALSRFRLALCTSASRPTLEIALARLGIGDCFVPIVTAEDVKRGKPDPEGLLKILSWHDTAPAKALVLEDADSGLAAAEAAGIDAIRMAPNGASTGEASWASLNMAVNQLHA